MPTIRLIVNGRKRQFAEPMYVPEGITLNQYLCGTIGPFYFDDYNVRVNNQSAYKIEFLDVYPKEGDKIQVSTRTISGSGPYPVVSFSLYHWRGNWTIYFAMKSMKVLHCEFRKFVIPVFFKVLQSTYRR